MAKMSKSYRKFFATAAAAALVTTAAVPGVLADAKDYTDVPERYQDAVDFVLANGVKGKSSTYFGTSESIKRVDAAVFLANVLGLDTVGAPDAGFIDVPDRAKGAVNALKEFGITDGKTSKLFDSNSTITRGELAIWIERGFGLVGKTDTAFADVSGRYVDSVQALAANDVTQGVSSTSFGVNASAKRGDYAIFLFKAAMAIENGDLGLTLMHTNDTHAQVEKMAKKITAIKEVREVNPDALLLDAGDVFSGTLYFNKFEGEADLALMNYIGYDAMTFGNHEFDLGASAEGHKSLSEFVKNAEFPFVSANTDFSKDELFNGLEMGSTIGEEIDGKIFDGIIKEVDGQKVGIFGLTTEETTGISSPGKVEFSNYIEEAERMVAAFEAEGINKIIALTHLGYDDNVEYDNDLTLAEMVDGIDVIVGGHTHTPLSEPMLIEKEEPTLIVQTGSNSDNLGVLDVEFDYYGTVTAYAGELISTKEKAEDEGALEIIKPFKAEVDKLSAESIGVTAAVALEGKREIVRTQESNLGNLITDGMLYTAKKINPETVIALTNGGGIRESIDAGDITLGEVRTTMPFSNTLGIMKLKGSELLTALEHSVSIAPEANGAFLHVSGMKFSYDSSKPAGERVVKVEVQNTDGTFTELDENKYYYTATNTFTAKGGDNYTVFNDVYKDGRLSEPGNVDYQMFIDYLQQFETIEPTVEGRIVDVQQN
ncbi:5'-nucleotidase C-terminal domain-containing protein [Bacillus sp. ISL-41]|uniref:bifunctional metallophosphatase/5'-nucleotidase n=1 Tax=Bacillus sp. ISL-41 TaxID=2819127 RepID=UPI0020352F38|nr:5'-nucleotidase C-terminal domain-containing protein [Bacillus sp. ISL-41]